MGYLRRISVAHFAAMILLLFSTSLVSAQEVSFNKTFLPATIGPGSVSTLRFTIENFTLDPLIGLAFTDTLPATVAIANPASASSTCGAGTLSAPAGGSTISFSGGLGGNSSCEILVNVTSSTAGTHSNVTSFLTWGEESSVGPAAADLTVVHDRPGFSKSFSPASISAGERSTLTFTIDNTENGGDVTRANFVDNLPSSMVIASPSNASMDCNAGTLVANPGSDSLSYADYVYQTTVVAANSSCTISADVTANVSGVLDNVSGDLTSATGFAITTNSGKASATLDVSIGTVHLIKEFTDDPAQPGGTVSLEFTMLNRSRSETATGIQFDDDLGGSLSELAAVGLPATDVCGDGSSLTGTSYLSFVGGTLGPGESCTFVVTLQVPGEAVPGGYANVTTGLLATLSESGEFQGNAGSDTLFVDVAPVLTKTFVGGSAGGGSTVTMQFSISSQAGATDIAFEDNLTAFMDGLFADDIVSLPLNGFCGAGSTMVAEGGINPPPPSSFVPLVLKMSGGSLAAGASCTFEVQLTLPDNAQGGVATNTTSEITATIADATRVGSPASADLTVVTTPRVFKEFTNDPVEPDASVNLQFTIRYPEQAGLEATDIAFTDDLGAMGISGTVAATGLPRLDVCGAGSQISGTTNLSFSGGTMQPGTECVIDVAVDVPAEAVPGTYTNKTSAVTAMVGGVETTGVAAETDLLVGGLFLSKSFTNDPVIPGGTVELEFTLDAALASTGIFFTDDLGSVLNGLLPVGLPLNDICGTGSSLTSIGQLLVFQGGSLAADASCVFSVTLDVPASAESGTYSNTTSQVQATIGDATVVQSPASDKLVVSNVVLEFSKSFDQATVAPGSNIDLTFTINNPGVGHDVTGITFTDDLGAALSELQATGLPANDVCGAGSVLAGTDVISLTGGSLLAGTSCQFTVTLSVPANAPYGDVVNNVTSTVTGLVDGLHVMGDPARGSFGIHAAEFTKVFTPDVVYPGDTTTLSFTITNLSSITLERLLFSDDLDAALTGLVASGLPLEDICGTGSSITGTDVLTFTYGILEPGQTCTFDVAVSVPGTAAPGSYTNITSNLAAGDGSDAALAASAGLVIEAPPTTTIIVCHKPGTPAEKTLEIDIPALAGHLRHGDYEGPCEEIFREDEYKSREGGYKKTSKK